MKFSVPWTPGVMPNIFIRSLLSRNLSDGLPEHDTDDFDDDFSLSLRLEPVLLVLLFTFDAEFLGGE